MNEALDNILTRRSVRKYKPEQVSGEQLEAILKAGTYAPTALGSQAPIMIVVQDKAVRDRLERMNAQYTPNPDGKPFYGAPTVIIVLSPRDGRAPVEDGALVLGNLLNAAHAVGVDSCWINRAKEVFNSDEGKALLKEWGIEGDWVGVGNCILGYRDCAYPEPKARKDGWIVRV